MMEPTCLAQLIEQFDEAATSDRVKVLKKMNVPQATFEAHATWKEGGYTRNCLGRRDSFEFILICWDKGACTPIHGHAGEDCWVYQVQGSVSERRYTETNGTFTLTNEAVLHENDITYMHDRMGYHALENISNARAMTLHVYANPIEKCKVFNDKEGEFEVVEMIYDSIREEGLVASES